MSDILQAVETAAAQKNFYPTPENVAVKMLEGIDWRKVASVLEPSAGKGDLAEVVLDKMFDARRGYGYKPYGAPDDYFRKQALESCDIDCIEIDSLLRSVLEGRGFRVVHDDFLTYRTHKRYDLIVMNPPFDQGAQHLLKALDLVKHGGEVRCLLNAETIRNPYSAARAQLASLLTMYGAEIVYLQNAFKHAERSTEIEIALVKVSIPKIPVDSTIMEDMRKAQEHEKHEVPPQYTDLAVYSDIEEWVSRYSFEASCGIRMIEEYEAMKPHMLDDLDEGDKYRNPILSLTLRADGKGGNAPWVNSYLREVRGKYWRALFQNKKFVGRLTSNLVDELRSSVNALKDYDFSVYNILTLMIKMNAKMNSSIEKTIVDLFDKWTALGWNKESPNRHYYNGWATNESWKVGKKVIIPFYGFDSWDRNRVDVWKVREAFSDIEKVFDFLDGGVTLRASTDDAIKQAADTGNTRNIKTKYFIFTFYKKGTAHLVFRDMDLLDKFNIFAGRQKGWLPTAYGKKQYKDMTRQEQAVVDSFQGRKEYERVMQRPGYYLCESRQNLVGLMAAGEI